MLTCKQNNILLLSAFTLFFGMMLFEYGSVDNLYHHLNYIVNLF